MRRLVFICMMLLLPLQWSWAAAATYCAHETGVAAKHVGHHEHQHSTASGELSKDAKPSSLPSLDNDCDYCQLSTVQWIMPAHAMPMLGKEAAPPVDDPLHSDSHIPTGPERPDRPLAA